MVCLITERSEELPLAKRHSETGQTGLPKRLGARVVLEIESVDIGGKSVLLICISESSLKPVSVKGVCYKRVGNSNRVMSPQEIAQMHLNATGQSWDQLLVTRAGIDDIDEKKVEWYLTRRVEKQPEM